MISLDVQRPPRVRPRDLPPPTPNLPWMRWTMRLQASLGDALAGGRAGLGVKEAEEEAVEEALEEALEEPWLRKDRGREWEFGGGDLGHVPECYRCRNRT